MPALQWNEVKQVGNVPTARSGHTITTVGKYHYMFGGMDHPGEDRTKVGPKNEVYVIRITSTATVPYQCEWTLKTCTGDVPLPRGYHAASKIQDDRIMVFGGYFTSSKRFNDTFLLKTSTYVWAQPPNQKSVGLPENCESKIGAPQPRANHSLTFHKGKAYVFGGHGGSYYRRIAFNDLYYIDTETFEWTKLEPKGNGPEPRGGHVATIMANKDKLLIFGGWSFCTQFLNIYIYNIETNEWEEPEVSHQTPKWNMGAAIAPSIPSWKYFIFGGSTGSFYEGVNRTNSKLNDDIWYLDIDSAKWNLVSLESASKPLMRQSPACFYSNDDQRFYVHGGWSNYWLGDLWCLPVGNITGPPYAIFELKPNLGPLTGKTKLTVIGAGFKENLGSITIKFTVGKGSMQVNGVYVDQTTITCETPTFEQFGPKKTDVRLCFGKLDYTIHSIPYTYYLNTKADKTLAYGPGLLTENAVGVDTMFLIQSRNTEGKNRESGSDRFVVKIKRTDIPPLEEKHIDPKVLNQMSEEEKKAIEEERVEAEKQRQDRMNIPSKIIDSEDGSYIVKFKSDEECEADLEIYYVNEKNELEPIRSSRHKIGFSKKAGPKNNELNGHQMINYMTSEIKDIGDFIERSKNNIEIRNKNVSENVKELLNVMENLNLIQAKKAKAAETLEVIEQYIKTLDKKYELKKEAELKKCVKSIEDIKQLELMAARVDKEITGSKGTEGAKTKEKIKKLEENLKEYQINLKKENFYQYNTGVDGAKDRIKEVNEEISKFENILKDYFYYQKMFELKEGESEGCAKLLDQIKNEVKTMDRLWEHTRVCQEKFNEYLELKFKNFDTNEKEDEIKRLKAGLTPIKVSDRKCSAFIGINEDIKKWSTFIPMLADLKDNSMNVADDRHWNKIRKEVKKDIKINDELVIRKIWELKLYDIKDKVDDITEMAKNEAKMELGIKKIVDFWKDVTFELKKHKDTSINTLKMKDQQFETLEEHQLAINTMLTSKYVAHFQKEVERWKHDLGAVFEVVQTLSDVQKSWSFLENLFIQSEEVKKELPEVSKTFIQIDIDVKEIMKAGQKNQNILSYCTVPGTLHKLETIQAELKKSEKALNEFLDSKRRAFPRFYFVSVNDLLDILSNGNSPEKINRHMSKIFQAIEKLELEETKGDRPSAKVMKSCVGIEEVNLSKPLKLVGKVEIYLQDIINAMISTLTNVTEVSVGNVLTLSREKWLEQDPSQITLLVNNIIWSGNVQNCIKLISDSTDINALKKFYATSVESLTGLIKMVQGSLSRAMRQKIMCLITMDTHSRDVVDKLIQENIRKADAFQWQSQLKFYWENKDAVIRIADAHFLYSYEYLGNGPRLVVTPLTDRIYVTATQALHLKMGCAPAGPAGTGKTETTKDLSNALAKACYVFNCSSEMNYESMGNIYKGLASSGCWGCFDEFNRLLPEVLSVCSVQFKAVTDAIKENKKRFVLQGDDITLNPTCGVFITMNPGYLGRAELPEGLKALFRPITVVVPDLELICENMLMAEGFVDAKILAKKFVTLYELCRDLLSKQLHYDWGLRAIKSVLVVAGGFKRGEPTVSEGALLMRALRDFNLPKIAFNDLEVFRGLLDDLFPGVKIERKRDMDFEKVIEECTVTSKLFPDPEFILKVVQLSELLEIRHCVFIMGPPGSGKTCTWKILSRAQDKKGKKTTISDLNPKVVSTRDLYGYTLPSKEWKDGLLSRLMRSLSELQDTNPKWLLLDGDLDANWIESMNSVMDDNKILTLANNERIPLKPHMRMIFEIRDLRFATPATVSRAGILYISDDSGYQWNSYVKSWLDKCFEDKEKLQIKNDLKTLFDKYIRGTLAYVHKNCKILISVSSISMIISHCKILGALLSDDWKNLEYAFVFSLIWAIGGCLSEKDAFDYRKEFSNWWKSEWKTTVKFPSKGTVFDYFVDNPKGERENEPCKFEEWNKSIQTVDFDTSRGDIMNNITVPTKETIATQFFIKKCISIAHPILMIGLAGCGKTQLAKGILRSIVSTMSEHYTYQQINFNYYTDAVYLQAQLEQYLQKKAGRQFGPPGKLHIIYYIDDLNMPQLDPYDTQNAISLLRQHFDYEHWYDIVKLTLKEIINTQAFASMNPSAGSFQVDPRFQRHFWTVSIPFPDGESLGIIYTTFLSGHFRRFKPNVQELAPMIVRTALTLHQTVVASFRKTAINFHYEFNLRHLSNVFQGIMLSDPSKFPEPEKMVKLWIHESERTYGDRLVSSEHLQKYMQNMFELVKKSFAKFQMAKYFTPTNAEMLIFSDFCTGIGGERLYDLMPNHKLRDYIDEGLKEYNDNNPVMNLVLFEDAMKHICRISRIITPSSGHALLVGVGGSGKQSLSKLSAFIMTLTPYMITISTNYGMAELKTDLQNLYNKTGIKEEGILFLFTEGQISSERFLVYINDLLSSGEIAELYATDEKEGIINSVRSKVKSEGKPDTKDNCWNYYIDKVKQKLHMSLCFSPVGDALRRRARQFPGLVNCTVIDWFFPWPKEALYDVAERFLHSHDLGSDDQRKAIISFMPHSFEAVNRLSAKLYEKERRYVYTTPKSFLELISLFCNMLASKRDALLKSKERYENGLIKLRETAEQVSVIKEEVKVKQVQSEVLKKSADQFAEKVGIEKSKAEIENNKAKIEADKCAIIKRDVEEKKANTEEDLRKAGPIIESALQSLNSINKKEINILKNYASPSEPIRNCLAATIWLLAGYWSEIEVDKNKKPKTCDWKYAQKIMMSSSFVDTLKEYKDGVDQGLVCGTNIAYVKKEYLTMEKFTPEEMKKASEMAAGLCVWIRSIINFYDIIIDVAPKRKALDESKIQLEEATKKLNEVEEVVRKLNAELEVLDSQYRKATDEKNRAIEEAKRCEMRLNLATRLVGALGSENERWEKSIHGLVESINVIVGDVLLASSFVSYAGPFSKRFRDQMIKDEFLKYFKAHNILLSPNCEPTRLLTDESMVAIWNQQKLPSDKVSIENGTILSNSMRYPLIIDPQLQGITWIREREKNNNLKSLRMGSKNINRDLELSIRDGFSAIIENMDQKIDAILMPVIARSFIKKGKYRIIKLAGNELNIHEKFTLFLQTQLSNPHYPPEIQAETTMINFTVTEDGLGDQLLSLVVARERPDLSAKKIELINQQNDFKIKLKDLEEKLLYKLANAKGDILDDIALIENLEYSKKISVEISEKVEIAKVTEARINEISQNYRPAASRGALIYFLLSDISKIHSFYKYSLEAFIEVINRSIDIISANPRKIQRILPVDEMGRVIYPKEEAPAMPAPPAVQKVEEAAPADGEPLKPKSEEGQNKQKEDDTLSPRSFKKRVQELIDSITYTTFQYTRKGLFEKHKLIISTMLTFRIQIRKGIISGDEFEHLIIGRVDPNPTPVPDSLKSFVNDAAWAACKGLQSIPVFNTFPSNLDTESLQWKKWFQEERVETADPPKAFKEISSFYKLMLLRALRPDRLTSALNLYVSQIMGEKYVEQQPFDVFQTFAETDNKTPIFFVLFPGVDPTPDVQRVAAKYNISLANGKFINISMGQGQEEPAKKSLFECAEKGHWIMLQNVHLMQSWLYGINGLEGLLQQVYMSAHLNFRIFISSEPPSMALWKTIPQSVLQASIKVANQAPQYLKANLRRAYNHFNQGFLDRMEKKPNEFKACLFALCYFHSLVLGRKKFGSQGWSRVYNFNDGDLTICADVLFNYLSKYEQVPWDDLKYIFGEIMYGGHITDNWDRRTNATYLKVLIKPELLLPNFSLLYNLFKNPDPAKYDYKAYKQYIEDKLPGEVPQMFGMHPNAEIGYLTLGCQDLCDTILDVQGGSGVGGGGKEDSVMQTLLDFKTRCPADTNMFDLVAKTKDKKTPFVVVCLQQTERMNILLSEIRKSLQDLRLGLTGALNITDAMESLQMSLQFNKVPSVWQKYAYPSRKSLSSWFTDLIERNLQVIEWCKDLVTPKSLCISYLFNPMSFLTAVMQNTARSKGLPLDNMSVQTDVTFMSDSKEVLTAAENGAYIHGLFLEGAAWENSGQGQDGYLIDQRPRELHPRLPVVNVIAVPAKDKKSKGQYICPVYYTTQRGPTYIFSSNLNMESEESDPNKWILSGTCLLMSQD